ncbi:MAG: zinc-binding alcohol dehydrogenase [Xanthobacteraceae bacterium]
MARDHGDGRAAALWYISPGKAELRAEPEARPGAADVVIRALHSALSRGTERLVFTGSVPETEFERMRCPFMAGAFPFPVKYGYAMVGEVAAGREDLRGRTVFALHPHQTEFALPADAVVTVPDRVPARRAVLAANMETALNAVWDAAPGPADRIAVVGGGVVGLLVAWLCGALPRADVTVVDIDPARAEPASRLGVGFALPDGAPRDCDLVVHASGNGAGLTTALQLAGDEATILELSWYGRSEVTAPFGAAFHSRRLRLISSQVGRVAPSHRSRWTPRRRLAAALDLLADPRLDVLLAPALPLADLPGRLSQIFSPKSRALCQVIDYPASRQPS